MKKLLDPRDFSEVGQVDKNVAELLKQLTSEQSQMLVLENKPLIFNENDTQVKKARVRSKLLKFSKDFTAGSQQGNMQYAGHPIFVNGVTVGSFCCLGYNEELDFRCALKALLRRC